MESEQSHFQDVKGIERGGRECINQILDRYQMKLAPKLSINLLRGISQSLSEGLPYH
jgi:hypothetical protein